jgi:hypothetical protein
MSTSSLPPEHWAAVVAAERRVVKSRSAFHHEAAETRRAALSAALRGDSWQRRTALRFLQDFHDDVESLVPELVGLALTDAWAEMARTALLASGRPIVRENIRQCITAQVESADSITARRLVELLSSVHDWTLLADLVGRWMASDDAELRAVSAECIEDYGSILQT